MAKHDVTKTPFSLKNLDGYLWNFGDRRQIDAGEGTKSFAPISAAVFELSRKSSRGGGRICLPRGLRVKKWQIFAIFSAKKVIYRADGGALYIFPFFAGLGGSKSVLGWIFYLLTVTLAYKQALDHFKIFATLSFLTSWPWMAMTWHEITTGSYVSHTRFTLFHQPCFRLKRLLCTGKRAMTNSQKSDLWPDPWRYQRPPSDEVYQNMRRKVMYGEMKFRLRI